jgi:hypothetical protein
MDGIPGVLESDIDDVAWALQTADTLWKRQERVEAIVWLRRAAQAAGDAEDDDRALALARAAAELADHAVASAAPSVAPLAIEAPTREAEEIRPEQPQVNVRVPSAAEAHAGMLDPWADGDGKREKSGAHAAPPRTEADAHFDAEEVVTSAPVLGGGSAAALDLSQVEAFADVPDDARQAFAAAVRVEELARDEEASGFALALVVSGSVDLAATVADAPAHRFEAGSVVRARGRIEHATPVRLIAASDKARVAIWDERSVVDAFRTCPWVEDELRAAGDHLQALVGASLGPLGDRLDAALRAAITSKLSLRALGEHEIFAQKGRPLPGLLVVGAGELEFVGDDGAPDGEVVRAGEFLFADEVLSAAPAPSTVRASRGGALVLFAERAVAQELLVSFPPLLEILAGV